MTKLPRRRVAVLSMLILLATTAIATTAQADAPNPGDGEEVTGVEGVHWKNVHAENKLYLTREDTTDEVGRISQIGGLAEPIGDIGTLTTDNPGPVSPGTDSTTEVDTPLTLAQYDPYLVRDVAQEQGVGNVQTVAQFQTDPLQDDVTISGASVMDAKIHVIATPGLNWTIRVCEIPEAGASCPGNNDANLVGREFFTHQQNVNPLQGYRPNITLSRTISFAEGADGEHAHTFEEGSRIRIEINASTGPNFDAGVLGPTDDLPTSVTSRYVWILRREGPSGQGPLQGPSHLTLRSGNSVQITGWVTDHQDNVASIFTNHTEDRKDEIGARFAIRSAFPGDVAGTSADFRLERLVPHGKNQTVTLQPGGNTTVEMEKAPGLRRRASDLPGDPLYQRGWRLPEKYWNYDQTRPGQFRAHMSADGLRQKGQPSDLAQRWDFQIADQAVQIEPFRLDSTSHLIQPGSTTTYLLRVLNAGSSQDTLDLRVDAPGATQQGWTTDIEAPNLKTGKRLELDSGESALVRVTVQAPEGVSTGSSQSFTFNATSSIDIEASEEITLLATASNEVRQDVGIFPAADTTRDEANATLGPRDNASVTLYVWNDATVTNDIKVGLERGSQLTSWNTSLEGPGSDGGTVTVKGVGPGDVATVTVNFQTLGGLDADAENPETVNATIAGAPVEPAEITVTGRVELDDDVEVKLLDPIATAFRYMEMECDATICPTDEGIPTFQAIGTEQDVDTDSNDAVRTMLVRTWITNTGDDTEKFNLRIVGQSETPVNDVEPYRCPFAFTQRPQAVRTPSDPGDADPTTLVNPNQLSPEVIGCQLEVDGSQPDPATLPAHEILRKSTNNVTNSPDEPIQLEPGQTVEYYVEVHHRTSASSYATTNFEFSVVADCVGNDCSAFDRDNVEVRGRNGVADKSGVLVEPVARNATDMDGDGTRVYDDEDALPLVQTGIHEQDSVTRTIVPGQRDHVDFRVRVTHGASFSALSQPGDVTVDLTGISTDKGWEADLIPVTATGEQTLPDPVEQFTFDNIRNNNGRAVAYQDMEFLVRMYPPSEAEMTESTPRSANVILEADSQFGSDIVELTTELARVPKLNMTQPAIAPEVQPDEGVAFGLGLRNSGTSAGTFELRAKTETGWQVDKPFANVSIPAQSTTSLPLIVSAPPTANPGENTTVRITATWEDEVTGNFQRSQLQCEQTAQGYVPADPDAPVECLAVDVSVVERGDLSISPVEGSGAVISPGGDHTFSLEVKNTRDEQEAAMPVKLRASAPNSEWSVQLTRTDFTGEDERIPAGESRTVNLFVNAPDDVLEGSSHSFVVAAENTATGQIAQELLTVDVIRGKGRPVVDVKKSERLIERGSFTKFEVDVRNVGTATANFELTVDGINREGWDARIEDRTGLPPGDSDGDGTPDVRLPPNQETTLFVNVTAPFEDVARGTSIQPSFVAFTPDLQTKAEVQFTARIQDYGVALSLPDKTISYVPGTSKKVPYKITNTGNGNDTLNVSMTLQGLEDWTVTFDEPRVRLEPGESEIVEAKIRSPRSPLPSARSVTFTAWAGTTEGAAVNQWQNRSQPFVVEVLEYRSQDVDDDGFVELAVDTTPRDTTDGFPHYREIFPEGQNATLRTSIDADDDGMRDFLLDNPARGGIDGIADIFWDPDDIVVYKIEHRPDLTYDDSPDYLIDSDGDDVVDTSYNSGNLTVGAVEEVSLGQGTAKQFIVDTSGDGAFDKFYDPAADLISETGAAPGQGADTVGLDTTGDGSIDTFYNTEDDTVETATFANASQFAQDYWYLVVLFGLVLVVGIVAVARR